MTRPSLSIESVRGFHVRINSACKKSGLRGAADLARVTGMNRITLGAYLRGERMASLESCTKLARALGCSPSWLYCGRENRSQDNELGGQTFERGKKREIVQGNDQVKMVSIPLHALQALIAITQTLQLSVDITTK